MSSALKAGPLYSIARVDPLLDATDALANPDAIERLATTHGYLFAPGLVPREKVMAVRADVLALLASRGWLDDRVARTRAIAHPDAAKLATRDDLLLLQGDIQTRPAFAALRHDPAILAVLAAIFQAPPIAGHGDVCRIVFPSDIERTTAPHQDLFYTRGSIPMWSVWIPLGDTPSALGGLAVVPGSHRNGVLPHDEGDGETRFIAVDNNAAWASASYRAGDVLLLSALTVHAARANVTTNRIRMSVDCRYRPVPPTGAG